MRGPRASSLIIRQDSLVTVSLLLELNTGHPRYMSRREVSAQDKHDEGDW